MAHPPRDPRDPWDAFMGGLLFSWTDWLPKAVRPWAVAVVAALFVTGCVYLQVRARGGY